MLTHANFVYFRHTHIDPKHTLHTGPNPLLRDLLCLGGSALYAISNVAQDFLVKNHSIAKFLGLIGVTGSVVSGIQL